MAAEQVQRQAGGQLDVAVVEHDPPGEDCVHQRGDMVGREGVPTRGRAMCRPVAKAISFSWRWNRAAGKCAEPPTWS